MIKGINVGDTVVSTICKTMFGTVKKIINENDFIMQAQVKEILCNKNYWRNI